MKDKISLFETDDRAVSPVIGVILMVAITVILAAVIGTFVLDLGQDLQDEDPAPSLAVDANVHGDFPEDYDGTGGETLFVITFQTGDSIETDDMEIILRDEDGVAQARFNTAGEWADANMIVVLNNDLEGIQMAGEEFGAGDTITIIGDGTLELEDNTEHTLELIHEPSGSSVSTSNVQLPPEETP